MRYDIRTAKVTAIKRSSALVQAFLSALLIVAALAWTVGSALAQAPPPSPYEMRAYVDPTTDNTRMFNMSSIRASYVCLHCGYSSYYGNGQTCPNPWGLSGHPNVNLVPVPTRDRVLTSTLQNMPLGARDYEYRDTAGNLAGRAIVGKPFYPLDRTPDDILIDFRSRVYLRTVNLYAADGADKLNAASGSDEATRLRLFVTHPGVTRPVATQTNLSNIDMSATPTVLLFDANADAAVKAQFISVGLNPYRLDNGDQWLIRYTRTDTGGAASQVRVQAASLLYGLDMDITDGSPTAATEGNLYVSNSGALTIRLHHDQFDQFSGAAVDTDTTWLFHFTVQSNTRLMPRSSELSGVGEPALTVGNNDLTDWAWDRAFPTAPKKCWLVAGTGTGALTGGITDDSDVAETGNPVVPYHVPRNSVGVGVAAVQYANSAGADDLTATHTSEGNWRFYKGWEWQYDFKEEVTNQKIARKQSDDRCFRPPSDSSDTHRTWVQYLAECRFFSSRVEFPPPTEDWVHSDGSTPTVWPNLDYARVVVGEVDEGNNTVLGEYGPGTSTPTRYFYLFNRFRDGETVRRCDFCGYMKTGGSDRCPYHSDRDSTTAITTYFRANADLWRKMMVAGVIEAAGGTSRIRQVLPDGALKFHEYYRIVYPAWVNPATSREQSVHIEIPPYQPPSVPHTSGARYENDLALDQGYRGGLIMHGDQLNYPGGSTGALSSGWDAFYRCPDCGQLVRGYNDPDNVHPSGSCPGHQICPWSGVEYPAGYDGDPDQTDNQCGFSLGTLVQIGGDDTIQAQHISAEEYDVGDIQVSVARKPAMRAGMSAVQIGRVQPGVIANLPDTNVQGDTGGEYAFPAAVSPRAALSVVNEGNITSPVTMANVFDVLAGSGEMRPPHYSRIQVPPYDYSYGRIAQSTPITRRLMHSYDPQGDLAVGWNVLSPLPFSASGVEMFGRLQAGTVSDPVPYPVPLGQPAGTYVGQTLYFLDVNDNRALDFRVGGPAGTATDTNATEYDPLVDYPLEPVYDTVLGDIRVFASRLPHSDYFSADSSPVPIVDADNRLQVIWMSNRTSAQSSVGSECAPGSTSADIPGATAPVNLLYATADFVDGGSHDPLYRDYRWPISGGRLAGPRNLTNDAIAGTINSSPWALGDDNNTDRWAFWHRRLSHPGGVEATLRFDTSTGDAWSWSGSGSGEWIYAGGLPQENIRSFVDPDGDHWLFWHTGSEGKQYLMYRWDYELGTVSTNEGPVPVTNVARSDWRADTFPTIDPLDNAATVRIQKPSQSPFTYTKDPSVFLDPLGRVNLFFSGYVRSEGEADICWTRFDPNGMSGTDPTIPNYGKLTFGKLRPEVGPYVYASSSEDPVTGRWTHVPEQFNSNGLRQLFTSRHLDWLTHHAADDDNFAVSPHAPSGSSATLNPTAAGYIWSSEYRDPVLCLALIYDAVDDGHRPQAQMFYVTWSSGQYFRSRGVYRVLPRLYPLSGGDIPDSLVSVSAGGYTIQDQAGRDVMMEINPATGAVGFSTPLFNVDNPADPLAVFNDSMSVNGSATLTDVVMYGSYYPYVYRVTRNGADDDCPSAFYNADVDASSINVFWRRRFPATSSPHFGRTGFMHKSYSSSVRVNRPSITAVSPASVVNAYNSAQTIPFVADSEALAAGILAVPEEYLGYTVQVTYTSSNGGTYTEAHQVPGWSVETAVPIRTGGAEGRLVVKPETYTVPNGSGAHMNTVRYWLFWTGLGSVYDLRALDAGSARADGDPLVMQSADIYSAVVSPDPGAVVRERPLSSVSFDPS